MVRARKGQTDNGQPKSTKPATEQPSSLETLRRHRIVRVRRQNQKLLLELKQTRSELVPADAMKREVLAANAVVKSQLLSLPHRLGSQLAQTSDPYECSKLLKTEIVTCLNDLAHSREQEPDVCPCCGKRMKEEER